MGRFREVNEAARGEQHRVVSESGPSVDRAGRLVGRDAADLARIMQATRGLRELAAAGVLDREALRTLDQWVQHGAARGSTGSATWDGILGIGRDPFGALTPPGTTPARGSGNRGSGFGLDPRDYDTRRAATRIGPGRFGLATDGDDSTSGEGDDSASGEGAATIFIGPIVNALIAALLGVPQPDDDKPAGDGSGVQVERPATTETLSLSDATGAESAGPDVSVDVALDESDGSPGASGPSVGGGGGDRLSPPTAVPPDVIRDLLRAIERARERERVHNAPDRGPDAPPPDYTGLIAELLARLPVNWTPTPSTGGGARVRPAASGGVGAAPQLVVGGLADDPFRRRGSTRVRTRALEEAFARIMSTVGAPGRPQ